MSKREAFCNLVWHLFHTCVTYRYIFINEPLDVTYYVIGNVMDLPRGTSISFIDLQPVMLFQ